MPVTEFCSVWSACNCVDLEVNCSAPGCVCVCVYKIDRQRKRERDLAQKPLLISHFQTTETPLFPVAEGEYPFSLEAPGKFSGLSWSAKPLLSFCPVPGHLLGVLGTSPDMGHRTCDDQGG